MPRPLRSRSSSFRASLVRTIAGCVPVAVAVAIAPLALTSVACAQEVDLYDPTVLRTVNLQFQDANWWQLLQQNYISQTNILADLTVEGITYPNVGVRIRGNTSYTALPAGSQKVSLNIEMDFVEPSQNLFGYGNLNFNNGFRDPTFCREVVYNNIVAQFMPNGRANHIVLTINGENWGVYNNIQQYDKDLLRDHFDDEDGLRIKCANNPNGPGLRYVGSNPGSYTAYEIKSDGGLADPIGALIAVCDSVTNEPLATWPEIDELFAIDPSIWSVALENLLTDDDSYVNKGCDFTLYRDPADGRMHLHQTDANETFTQWNWSPTRNFTAINKPVLSRVLAVSELRQRYMAHYRAALAKVTWAELEPLFNAQRALIEAAVQADTKKIYSYTLFQNNFTQTVTLPGQGPAGGTLIGIKQFVDQRQAYLGGIAEVAAQGPAISAVSASSSFPDPSETVWIQATVVPATGGGVSSVELFYQPTPGPYLRTTMFDNGLFNDGAAGDGVYGVALPITALAGQRVRYYIAARATNSFQSFSFEPTLAENGPLVLEYSFGGSGLRVTEYMYSGPGGEFLELTNTGGDPIDLTGWSLDDDSATPGVVSLSAAGVLAPGASLIVTEATATSFAAAWGLSGVPIIGSNSAANLGRNDAIHVFDAQGNLVERLRYGDESYPGTIRAQNASGQVCSQAIGQDAIADWTLAAVGDAFGSVASVGGAIGTPGSFVLRSCYPTCDGDLDADGAVDAADLAILLGAWGASGDADLDGDGVVTAKDLASLLGAWGACP